MTKVKRACLYCGKELETTTVRIKDKRGKFCSRKCHDNYRREKPNTARMNKVLRKCVLCGKQFYEVPSRIRDGRGKYCSPECYWKSKKGKPSGRYSKVTMTCVECGKSFPVNKARAETGQTKFCSRICQGKNKIGKSPSEEIRRKLSEIHKKRKQPWLHTSESIKKMGESKRGKPSWNTGKSWSVEQKESLSRAHMGGETGYARLQRIAEKKGWETISSEKNYTNNKSRLKFKCPEGHEFSISLSKALSEQGCGECNKGVSERTCRWYFEHIFGGKFPSTKKLDWLISPKGYHLELDGYCEKLKLAFEFQGEQHSKPNKFFNKKQPFEERKQYDEIKRKACSERGITLIEILDKHDIKRMDKIIIEECMKAGVDLPESDWYNPEEIDVSEPNRLKEYRDIAISRRGACLSTRYVNNATKLLFQCEQGHKWEASPGSIKSGTWCRRCKGLAKGTIEEMQKIATDRNGECLSTEYNTSQTKLKWKCNVCSHEWMATPNNIKRGKWCPKCGKKKMWISRRKKSK